MTVGKPAPTRLSGAPSRSGEACSHPSADVLALASIEVDISAIQPGQAIKTVFRKQPLFIRHLTPAEIQAANAVDKSSLRDPQSLADRTKPGKSMWLVTMGVCTHL